jgi:hypothetical protein
VTAKLIPAIRDIVCLGLGSFGFIWQVTHGAELVLMTGCILVLGGPAVMAAWPLAGSTPASGSSPPSPPQPQPRPSPSPSPPGAGEP